MPRKNIVISILAVCVYLIFTSPVYCQSDNEETTEEEGPRLTREAQMAMVEAQRAFEAKDFATARKHLLDYLATNPEEIHPDVFLMLGYFWYSDGKLEEAKKVFKDGHAAYPDNHDLLSYYAATLYETEDFAKAGPMMEQVYEASPKKELRFLEAASGAYYQIKKFGESKRVIRKMIGLTDMPTDMPKENWYNMLFQMALEEEKLDEAQSVLFEALDLYPLNTTYWQQLGIIRQEKEDYAGMVGAYEIKNNIKPPEKEAQFKEAENLYSSMNVPLRVAKTIELSLKGKDGKEEDYLKIADAYAKAMKTDKALKYLDEIIQKKPSSALLLKKAQIIYAARRNKETIKACDDLIALNPKEGLAYYMKGNAAWDLEDWDTMEEAFTKARDFKDYRAYAKNALDYIQSLAEAKSTK